MPDMSLAHLAAFLGVSLVVIVTPGQDTALTIRNTLTSGRRGGVLTAFGGLAGDCDDYVGYVTSVPTSGTGPTTS